MGEVAGNQYNGGRLSGPAEWNRPLFSNPQSRIPNPCPLARPSKKNSDDPQLRNICENRKARYDYLVLDSLECGMILVGSEVKSLRAGRISLEEAYARVKEDEVWLVGCDIPEYAEASHFNHRPKRPRKLLLHRREIQHFARRAYEKGLTLVPLRLYFKEGKAKLLLGLCRGKAKHDKRQAMKSAEAKREMSRQMMRRR
jgi:SsrA-binding protein